MFLHSRRRRHPSQAKPHTLAGLEQIAPFPPPRSAPVPFVGREHELSYSQHLLDQRGVLAITGATGSGKTALVAALAAQSALPAFWIDIYPDLNQHAEPLLWQLARPLAHYDMRAWRLLHQIQQAGWGYPPIVRVQMILEAYAHADQEILLCIDVQQAIGDSALASLIVGLCDYVALTQRPNMRLIVEGNNLPYKVGAYAIPALLGLSSDAIALWADRLDLDISMEVVERIWQQTGGSPQAIAILFASLIDNPVHTSLDDIVDTLPIRRFVRHLLHPLTDTERAAISRLVRHPGELRQISVDAWPVLEFLESQHLVAVSSKAITIHPLLRHFYQSETHREVR